MKTNAFVASVVATFTAGMAHAQATEPFVLGTIYLGSDATTTIGIDNEDLTRTDPTDLQDVFSTEAAISVGSSLPVSQKIYVQGVEENNLNVTIDGARQNNRIFHHSATTYIDPTLLKAVRVDPGVAPADAGPAALAGAIAFETKDVDDLLEPGRTFGGRFSTGFESNGETASANLALYGRNGNFEYLVFGNVADGDVQEDGNGDTILGSSTSLESGLAKVAYNGTDGSRIELSYERVEDAAQRPFQADFAGTIGATSTRLYGLTRQNLVLSYTGGNTTNLWAPFLQLAYNTTELETGESAFGTFGGTSESVTGKAQNEFTIDSGTIVVGADFYSDSVNIEEVGGGGFFAEELAQNIGLFAQGRFDLADRARVSTGARIDAQRFEGLDGTSYENVGASSNVAADVDVTDTITLSAGVSHGWGGIALAESFIMDTGWVYPDEIEVARSENIYIGAATHLGALELDAKVFRTVIENARTPQGTPETTSDLESVGFEMGAQYKWAQGFVKFGYANINSEINGVQADSYSGRYLTTPVGEQIVLEVGHTFDAIGVTVGGDAQIALERTDLYNFGSDASPLPQYEVVNAFAEYKPRQLTGLTVRGEVANLFDAQYADHATYGQEFVDSDDLIPLYEPGRSFGVRVTYEF
ncbi:TonB-dependent receptor domain-containing protein [Yoonia sp. BS5-3]|uniref:TonB-dependent receptor domain-containing protein n=1 Tax=Yoonia phaeophyticola TaxID=3137369 RepID=A0ABZ2V8I3_9RHOB